MFRTMHVRDILKFGADSVKPDALIHKFVKPFDGDKLSVDILDYHLHNNVYIVGFGKAAAGMCVALENIINKHVVSGIISIPHGSKESMHNLNITSKVVALEGAKNNLPDNDSLNAAKAIYNLVSSLSTSDILFILVSGGGSALLPYPKSPVTLNEKIQTTKLLTSKGADIKELNTVRKRLSEVKGGELAKITKCRAITLILSDIVDDPLDLIASSPTVTNKDNITLPLKILEKYNLINEVPNNVLKVLSNITEEINDTQHNNIQNFIIGNNTLALNSSLEKAKELGYISYFLTSSLEGEAKLVGQAFAILAKLIAKKKELNLDTIIPKISNIFNITVEFLHTIIVECQDELNKGNSVCILSGGETTVVLNPNFSGKGGRNQEMVLSFSVEIGDSNDFENLEIRFSSMGTDGIDGPTDAAGAVAYPGQASLAQSQGLNPLLFLERNDSYNFYSSFKNGVDHVKCGHTGTNVMDLQALLISRV